MLSRLRNGLVHEQQTSGACRVSVLYLLYIVYRALGACLLSVLPLCSRSTMAETLTADRAVPRRCLLGRATL